MGEHASFDSSIFQDTPAAFFYHSVDPARAALRVRVLGANLTQTFSHHYPPEARATPTVLEKKTTGFLTTVTASGKRIVLAWAESGHGIGSNGDSLLPQDHVLQNKTWAKSAIKLSRILGINFSSLFDGGERAGAGPPGSFQAAHVEVKLATHAVTLLLKLLHEAAKKKGLRTITKSNYKITKQALLSLKQYKWKNNDAIHFEVYVSRKNCCRCGLFLQRLQEMTGVRFDLQWRERLVHIQYEKQAIAEAGQQNGNASRTSKAEQTQASPSPPPPPPKLDTYEKDGVIHYLNPLASTEQDNSPVDPAAVNEDEDATLDQRPRISRQSAPPRISIHYLSNVDKPLPATPVTEAPYWDGSDTGSQVSSSQPLSEHVCVSSEGGGFPFPMRSPRPYASTQIESSDDGVDKDGKNNTSKGGVPFAVKAPEPSATQLGASGDDDTGNDGTGKDDVPFVQKLPGFDATQIGASDDGGDDKLYGEGTFAIPMRTPRPYAMQLC